MVKRCCVKGCRSESFAGCNTSFHSFPKDQICRQQWQQLIQVNIGKHSVVCSRHFKPRDFITSNSRRTLVTDAIPSVFPVAKEKQISVLSNIQTVPPTEPTPLASCSSNDQLTSNNNNTDEPPFKRICDENRRSVGVQTLDSSSFESNASLARKIKILNQKLLRRDATIKSTKDLLDLLKKKCDNFDEVKTMINNNFEQIHLKLREPNKNGLRHSPELKKFALSLYFYSPRAYAFLREHLTLPHPATLRRELSTRECNVGFMEEVLEFLKITNEKETYLKDVALIFDGISIKADIKPDNKTDKVWGYVDFGGIVPNNSEALATEALVFQIVSFRRKFKCVIGYFFVNKTPASVQAQLILEAIRILHGVNITVRSITCDGTPTNRKTYEILGCHLRLPNMITSFKHPLQDTEVHCIFDPPHMIKLARNIFAETQLTSTLGKIDFNFIQQLHELQQNEGLRLANRLCNAHLNFFGKKMNVRLATQLISSSVADAIDFLRHSGDQNFQDSEATVEYIRWLDRVFDILNAKNPLGKGFKSPLRLSNSHVWTKILSETRDYLLTLKIDGIDGLTHLRKMPILGLIFDTYSVKNLAYDLLQAPENKLDYFLPYKCSQDHIEMFFSCIRAQGGNNDNPNALQFRYALRKLLYRNSVTPSINANCTDDTFEPCSVFTFGSSKRRLTEHTPVDPMDTEREQILVSYLDSTHLSDYKMNVIYYIAGSIVNKMLDKITCKHCKSALLTEKKINEHNYALNIRNFSAFTTFIDRGKLKFVSAFVFEVIKYCEKLYISLTSQTECLQNISKKKMVVLTVQYFSNKLRNDLIDHPVDLVTFEDSHEVMLVKLLADSYFRLRMFHHAKLKSMAYLGNRVGMRQKLHKTILFSNV